MKSVGKFSCLILVWLGFLLNGCSTIVLGPNPNNTPEAVFEEFWREFDQNYSGLSVRPVNWDSLYNVYRPNVNSQTTNTKLIGIFQKMIIPFKDNHVGFVANGHGYISLDKSNSEIADYLSQDVVERYLRKQLVNYQGLYFYEKTDDNIGYVDISTFASQRYSQQSFEYFDQILDKLKDTKGLIIDIRHNGGGNEEYAEIVASRFATTPLIYKYTRVKIGPDRTDYSDFQESVLQPRGDWKYTKPVVVLTNEYVFSTGINFLMMMRVQPTVTTVGTTTGDGVNGPIARELPNGWLIGIPSGLAYLPDKTVVEGKGITPATQVKITEEDRRNLRDTILEKALIMLK